MTNDESRGRGCGMGCGLKFTVGSKRSRFWVGLPKAAERSLNWSTGDAG